MEKVKAKRKSLTLEKKVEIIKLVANGEKHADIAKKLGIPRTTITTVVKSKSQILNHSTSVNSQFKKIRSCAFPRTEAALLKWLDVQREQNIQISGPILLEKAKVFAQKLGETEFKGSPCWIDNWKKRNGLSYQTVSGKAGAVNQNLVSNWLTNIWPLESEGYAERDIFNGDETGLFYRLLPNKTYSRKGVTCTGGKLSKERITVLLCSNADGTDKLKPLVIGKHENPRCFKTIKKKTLPLHYYWNSKAWMTREIFSDWLRKVDLQMRFKKRKILLLLDNCQPHKVDVKLNNIKIVFFPANVTSILQPQDQGIINETKKLYRSVIVRNIIDCLDNNKNYQLDILEAILNLSAAWNRVSPSTIRNCFLHSKVITNPTTNDVAEVGNSFVLTDGEIGRLTLDQPAFEEYVNVDAQVLTNELLTEEEILAEVCPTEESADSQEDSDEEDPVIQRPVVSTSQAISHLQDLKFWFLNRDEEDHRIFANLNEIESSVEKSRLNSLRQPSIHDYFVVNE